MFFSEKQRLIAWRRRRGNLLCIFAWLTRFNQIKHNICIFTVEAYCFAFHFINNNNNNLHNLHVNILQNVQICQYIDWLHGRKSCTKQWLTLYYMNSTKPSTLSLFSTKPKHQHLCVSTPFSNKPPPKLHHTRHKTKQAVMEQQNHPSGVTLN